MANVLDSIMNIINTGIFSLTDYNNNFHDSNRMNNMGRALEEFVKDSYSDTILETDMNRRILKQSKVFDYTGNNTNPPDAMLSGGNDGDAIEIKKIQSLTSELALNSSFPNHKAYKDSPMISKTCKNIPNWDVRDILYVVGCVNKSNDIKYLFMVYGLDYAADNELYINLKKRLKLEINKAPNFDFQETKEFGRLNHVDPLGITYLRLRGMWGIENPTKLFSKDFSINNYKQNNNSVVLVVNDDKWNTFRNKDKFVLFAQKQANLNIKDIKIQDPNNPSHLKNGKLISYVI